MHYLNKNIFINFKIINQMKKTILLMCLFGIVYGTASAQLKVA